MNNDKNPKISIITASYNYEKYISKTIESMINQTYDNWEMIVVDDGSKDNSVELIKSYCEKDSRIKLYQHHKGKNKGLRDTLLLGIKNATGEWVAFCESDDYYTPDHLEEKVKVINENPEVNFIFNDYIIEGNQSFYDNPYYRKCQEFLPKMVGNNDFNKIAGEINPVTTFSIVMVRKNLLKKLNYNSPEKPILDYFLWAQLSKITKFYYLDKKLSKLIKHQGSYITKCSNFNIMYWFKMNLFVPKVFTGRVTRTLLLIKLKLLTLI